MNPSISQCNSNRLEDIFQLQEQSQQFKHQDSINVFHQKKEIFGLLLQEDKKVFKKYIVIIINKIILGFKKKNIEIGENIVNEILDFSYNLYKKLKEQNTDKKINHKQIVIPVTYLVLNQNMDKKFFDYQFYLNILKEMNIKKRKCGKYIQEFKSLLKETNFSKNYEDHLREHTEQLFKLATQFRAKQSEEIEEAKSLYQKIVNFDHRLLMHLKGRSLKNSSMVMAYLLFLLIIDQEFKTQDFLQTIYGNLEKLDNGQNKDFPLQKILIKNIKYSSLVFNLNFIINFFRQLIIQDILEEPKIFQYLLKKKHNYFNKMIYLKKNINQDLKVMKLNLKFCISLLLYAKPIIIKHKFKKQEKLSQDNFSDDRYYHNGELILNQFMSSEDKFSINGSLVSLKFPQIDDNDSSQEQDLDSDNNQFQLICNFQMNLYMFMFYNFNLK